MKKKVLLTYMESGLGHITSMQAISDSLKKKVNTDIVEVVDSYIMQEDANPVLVKFEKFICREVKHTNKLPFYGSFIFKFLHIMGKDKFMRLVHRTLFLKIVRETINAYRIRQPDIIVSTHYYLTFCAYEYKKKIPQVEVITYNPDNNVHVWWDSRPCGVFFVNNSLAYKQAIDKHNFLSVHVKQIPFASRQVLIDCNEDKMALRKKYNFPLNNFTIVIADGIFAKGKSKKITELLLTSNRNLTIIVLTGKNKKVYSHFISLKDTVPQNILFLPLMFTPEAHELYKLADIFLTKAGPNAILDSIFMNTPVIVTMHAQTMEKAAKNLFIDYLQCGYAIYNVRKVKEKVEYLCDNPHELFPLIENTKKISKFNNGADIIAQTIIDLI